MLPIRAVAIRSLTPVEWGSFLAKPRNSAAVATSTRIASPRAAIATSQTRWQHKIMPKANRKPSIESAPGRGSIRASV